MCNHMALLALGDVPWVVITRDVEKSKIHVHVQPPVRFYGAAVGALKQAVDPHSILAPGRYGVGRPGPRNKESPAKGM
jgi:hypothetical protein